MFVHLPKTGGVWVARALAKHAKTIRPNKSNHGGHIMPDLDDNVACFCFVRHPVSWLRSLFHHRKRKRWNWQTHLDLEKKCQAKTLKDFINKVANNEGVVESYFDHYIGKYSNKNNNSNNEGVK